MKSFYVYLVSSPFLLLEWTFLYSGCCNGSFLVVLVEHSDISQFHTLLFLYETGIFHFYWWNLYTVWWCCYGVSIMSLTREYINVVIGEEVLPTLSSCSCYWKRYVDDTYTYIVPEKVQFIFKKLNSLHPNMQFTFELEKNNAIGFLDVFIKKKKVPTSITYMHHQTLWNLINEQKLLVSMKPC